MLSIVIFAMYSATLTSQLAVYKSNMPFENLDQLIRQAEYQVSGIKGSLSHRKLSSIVPKDLFMSVGSMDEAIAKINADKIAFAWDSHSLDYFMEDSCDYRKAKESLYDGQVAFPVKKGFEYTQLFDY